MLPSLLQCDFGNLEREVRQLEAAGVQALHLDVMDGRFCLNFHVWHANCLWITQINEFAARRGF